VFLERAAGEVPERDHDQKAEPVVDVVAGAQGDADKQRCPGRKFLPSRLARLAAGRVVVADEVLADGLAPQLGA
jgi:hypothetical protein